MNLFYINWIDVRPSGGSSSSYQLPRRRETYNNMNAQKMDELLKRIREYSSKHRSLKVSSQQETQLSTITDSAGENVKCKWLLEGTTLG
jgi:hypothetical protein